MIPSRLVARCTLCGADALGWREPDQVLLCAECGERFPSRSGVLDFMRAFDDYTENYDRICRDDLAEPKTPGIVKRIFAELVRERARGRICDLGCGDGYVVTRLAGEERLAADLAFAYLARLPSEITRIWCRAEHLPLKTGGLEAVVCTDLIEHVLDAHALAREIERIVSPEGAILMAFPFEQDLSVYTLPEYKAKYGKYKYVHLRSIDDALVSELFPRHDVAFSRLITEGMELMEFKPYPIKFVELRRKGRARAVV